MIVLGVLGADFPNILDSPTIQRVSQLLLQVLRHGGPAMAPQRMAAAELLGKGYHLWRKYIDDAVGLMKTLFALSLDTGNKRANASTAPTPPEALYTSMTSSAQQAALENAFTTSMRNALLLIGAAEPKLYVTAKRVD